jgi:hypothetical protein
MTTESLPPEVREGEALSASWLNALRACVRLALTRSHIRIAGLEGSQGVHGTTLRAGATAAGSIVVAKSTGGSIAANATGTVTLYQWGSLTTLSALTMTVYNPGPDVCPASKKVWIGEANGKADSVLFWSCADA